jgi:hypothetical protein
MGDERGGRVMAVAVAVALVAVVVPAGQVTVGLVKSPPSWDRPAEWSWMK